MKQNIIYTLIIILAISSCKLGPDFKGPEYDGPQSFRFDSTTTDTIVNLRWWEMFNDDVLDLVQEGYLSVNTEFIKPLY